MSVSVRRAEFMLLMVTVCWAVSFPAIKAATPYASPSVFVGIRFTLSTLLLVMAWPWLVRTLPTVEQNLGWRLVSQGPALRWGGLMGVLIALGYTTQTIGLHTTTANNSAFITALSVVLVPVLLFVLRGQKPAMIVGGGILLSVAGLALLTRPDLGQLTAGDGWTLACAVSYAFYLMFLNDALKQVTWLPLLFWTLVVCAVLNIGRAVLFEDMVLVLNRTLLGSLLVTTLLSTLVGLILQNRFQGYSTPTRAALIFSAEPVFAAICSWFVLHEVLAPVSMIGAALIVSAVLLIEVRGPEAPPVPLKE